jgi:hypothetical protein
MDGFNDGRRQIKNFAIFPQRKHGLADAYNNLWSSLNDVPATWSISVKGALSCNITQLPSRCQCSSHHARICRFWSKQFGGCGAFHCGQSPNKDVAR